MVEVHFEDVSPLEINFDFLESWYEKVCGLYDHELGEINVVFCSDEYLLDMNKEHLNHDFYTDIITFDYCLDNVVSGDLFVSVDRVREKLLVQ